MAKKVVGIFVKVKGTKTEELGRGLQALQELVAVKAHKLGHTHIRSEDVWVGKRRPRNVSRILDCFLDADKTPVLTQQFL